MTNPDERPVFETENPATGEPGKSYPGHTAAEAAERAHLAAAAQRGWRRTGFADRARCMERTARVLRARRDVFAALMADEMGKPVGDGRAEVDKCAGACEHFAANAARYLAREDVAIENAKAFVTFQPLGVVL